MVFLKYKREREKYIGGGESGWLEREGMLLGWKCGVSLVYGYYRRGSLVERVCGVRSVRSILREVYKEGRCVIRESMSEEDQLKYIMPKEILKEMGIEKDWDEEISYEWAYCDHFWEAEVIVTRIPLSNVK